MFFSLFSAFIVLRSVLSVLSQNICWEELVQDHQFCGKCDNTFNILTKLVAVMISALWACLQAAGIA